MKRGSLFLALSECPRPELLFISRANLHLFRQALACLLPEDVIALFEFELTDEQVTVRDEKHYRLVLPEDLSAEELAQYRRVTAL